MRAGRIEIPAVAEVLKIGDLRNEERAGVCTGKDAPAERTSELTVPRPLLKCGSGHRPDLLDPFVGRPRRGELAPERRCWRIALIGSLQPQCRAAGTGQRRPKPEAQGSRRARSAGAANHQRPGWSEPSVTRRTRRNREHHAVVRDDPARSQRAPVRQLDESFERPRIACLSDQGRIAGAREHVVHLAKRALACGDPVCGSADLARVDQRLRLLLLQRVPVSRRLRVRMVDRIRAEVFDGRGVVLGRRIDRRPHVRSGHGRGPLSQCRIVPDSRRGDALRNEDN